MQVSDTAQERLNEFARSLEHTQPEAVTGALYAGVDLGTANIVTAVVDDEGRAVAGKLTHSQTFIRDGLVLDYVGAIGILRQQVTDLRNAGFPIKKASVAFPPGTVGRNCEAFSNVLWSVGLEAIGQMDEPSAASLVLDITDGGVVDIGGGTTGISVLREGKVVYTADEPTGGVHLDLVIAGHFNISTEEAERMKNDPGRQGDLFPLVRPVFQKMASIVRGHLSGSPVETLYLVGGTSCFPGIAEVMTVETGLNVVIPPHPLLVTPLGIAHGCRIQTEAISKAG